MKLTIRSEVLLKLVSDLAKAIPAKPAQPILANFLMETHDGLLRITASDGEIALRGLTKPDTIDEQGKAAIPAKILLELLRTLPSGTMTLSTDEGAKTVLILWGSGDSTLPTFDVGDYIAVAVPGKDANRFTIESENLSEGIGKTIFAVSTDDSKPALCGLFFDLDPTGSHIVASDAARLVCHSFATPDLKAKCSFILPAKAATILKGILQKEQTVKVVFDEKNVRFMFGAMEMTSRLVVGKFPAYRTIIPSANENILNVNRDQLLNVIKRMSVLAEKKSNIVEVRLSFNSMEIFSEDIDCGTKGQEKFEVDYNGADLRVGLKIPTMADTLSNIASENVEIRIKDERRAVLVQPSEEDRTKEPYEAVLMPYRLR